jgi:4'-phosphopantetheinyl transferase
VRYALRRLSPGSELLPWRIREGGKPCLPTGAPFFNLSHSNHGVAVVLSDKEEVGVDLEEIRPHALRLAERFYSEKEQAAVAASADPQSELIRIWSAKEAEAKRLGTGLGNRIAEISTDRVAAIRVELGGKPHWLSVSPATAVPAPIKTRLYHYEAKKDNPFFLMLAKDLKRR